VIFGEKLKELREDRGLRQEDIGALFGFGKSTVSQWESGKSQPEFDIVVKLADFFKVSIDYLMGRNTPAVIYENLIKDLTEEEVMSLCEQADFYRYRKKIPQDGRDGSSGLTDIDKDGNKLKFKGQKKRQTGT